MSNSEKDAQAMRRFTMLNIVRSVSAALVMLGVAIISGSILPGFEFVGYGFVILGAVEFFLMPVILKRMWNMRDEKLL
jgi:hypothetical protein